MSLAAIERINAAGVKCSVLTKGILPLSLAGYSRDNEYGITLISTNEAFRKRIEPHAAPWKKRVAALRALHDAGCKTWVSIEPFPTPNIVKQDLTELLEEIAFTDRIIFGRMNYNKQVTAYPDHKKFFNETRRKNILQAFADEISAGRIKTRESPEVSIDNFVKTKASNLRDYADACVRYLRATGLVTISNPGRTITIIESRRDDVKFILDNVSRDPVFVNNEAAYSKYLFDAETPKLIVDNRNVLVDKAVKNHAVETKQEARAISTADLKKKIKRSIESHKTAIIASQITELKSFTKYNEVMNTFDDITRKDVYDPPLALEWNAWRAMTMLDGGTVFANLNFDDAGNPLSTAPGNTPDIVCDYGDFFVTVEVTLQAGSKQFDAEGEPVARHLGNIKTKTSKDAYCFFVAPTINESTISHFYMLHRTTVKHYGGKSVIIPLTLQRFMGMLTQSKNCGYVPQPEKIRKLFEYSIQTASTAEDEQDWYDAISTKADNWLETH